MELGAIASVNEQGDWRWQARHAITTLAQLEGALTLTDAERRGVARLASEGLPLRITPYYLSLANREDPACPIRRQCVPCAAEGRESPGDMRDPLGEQAHEVAPGLIQRYPDRALLLVTDRCAVYCRFCTRSRMVGQGSGAQAMAALAPALEYLRAHRQIREVIVSGGDPGLLSDGRIAELLGALAAIEHLDHVRFATRVPVTLPQRVTPGFCRALRSHQSLWVMTHFNHPRELSPEARLGCARLVDAGLPVMNQTVLLRGVNDEAPTLEALFRGLVRARVRPYYLLQADPVRGTGHLRTPLARGMELMAALEGRVSGIALPRFVVDSPGGHGKVPLWRNAIVAERDGVTTLRTFRGRLVDYVDAPGGVARISSPKL